MSTPVGLDAAYSYSGDKVTFTFISQDRRSIQIRLVDRAITDLTPGVEHRYDEDSRVTILEFPDFQGDQTITWRESE